MHTHTRTTQQKLNKLTLNTMRAGRCRERYYPRVRKSLNLPVGTRPPLILLLGKKGRGLCRHTIHVYGFYATQQSNAGAEQP